MISQRHDLIYLDSKADFSIYSLHGDKTTVKKQVKAWLHRGLPCIYATQVPDEETVHLGLPLLFAHKKHRVGLKVSQSAVIKQQPLPQLIEMQDFFLRCYGVNELLQVPGISVYGSFLFHYLSGQPFVDEHSDLDLLIDYQGYFAARYSLPTSRSYTEGSRNLGTLMDPAVKPRDVIKEEQSGYLHSLNGLITSLTQQFNRAIDGEVRFNRLGDIPIKELLDGSAKKLLCKSRDRVALLSRTELYEHYPLL